MAAHAPQEVIDELLQRYNQAMQRYLQALAAEFAAMPASRHRPTIPTPRPWGSNDLQKLMQAIQQLSHSGNREQAAQMLAVLQNMLENMRISQPGQRPGRQQPAEYRTEPTRSRNMAT